MTGHMMGATGGVESVITVLSVRDGKVHPTINYETLDPACDLDYVADGARDLDIRVAIKNSFGLGGQNACIAFGKWTGN